MSDFYDNLVQKNTTKAVAVKTKEVNPKDLEVCPDNELTLSEIIAENKALKEKISLAVAKAPVKKAPRKAKEKAHDTAKAFTPAKEKKSFLKERQTLLVTQIQQTDSLLMNTKTRIDEIKNSFKEVDGYENIDEL